LQYSLILGKRRLFYDGGLAAEDSKSRVIFMKKIFFFIINFGHRSQETHVYMKSKARKAAFEVGIVECIPVPMPPFCFS
jgi:hypothetical protein